jgi:uncharacterized damage-inducible protein DinB
MLTEILKDLYERDLNKLKAEVELYADGSDLWKTGGEITNSAGNLCLHLAGNLQYFVGAVLGESGYVRDRDAEFRSVAVSREVLLAKVDAARADVISTLGNISVDDFEKPYPLEVFGHPMTTGFFLVHLATHLNYHLGQINYHRRLIGGRA